MKYVPLDCPICTYILRDGTDAESYIKTGCCVDCWESFLQPLRVIKEDDAYLPSETVLAMWREKLRKQNDLIKQG